MKERDAIRGELPSIEAFITKNEATIFQSKDHKTHKYTHSSILRRTELSYDVLTLNLIISFISNSLFHICTILLKGKIFRKLAIG